MHMCMLYACEMYCFVYGLNYNMSYNMSVIF
jgi:hypothetical protein